MKACMSLCFECAHSLKDTKRMKCEFGKFDVRLSDGLLFVPYDFDCTDFEKENNEAVYGKD